MPNHITNIIEIQNLDGAEIEQVKSSFLNKEGLIDFELISPSPNCLHGFKPHTGIVHAAKALAQEPLIDDHRLLSLDMHLRTREGARYYKSEAEGGFSRKEKIMVDQAVQNIKECGHAYWYDWNLENWDTKWNAYGQESIGEQTFKFETAWSHPSSLIEKISTNNPSVTFLVKYADEDTGSNCGSYQIKNGEKFNEDIAPPYSQQTDDEKRKYTKFAFELQNPGADPRSGGFDENWQYSEEVYDAYEASKSTAEDQ